MFFFYSKCVVLLTLQALYTFSLYHGVHPPDRYPAKFGCVLLYSPCLFGKKLFCIQDKLVNNKHTSWNKWLHQSEKVLCCCLIFELILLFVDTGFWCCCCLLFRVNTYEIDYIWSWFGKVCREKMNISINIHVPSLLLLVPWVFKISVTWSHQSLTVRGGNNLTAKRIT